MIYKDHRFIPVVLVGVVIVIYSAVYMGALSTLHTNGLGPEALIVSTGEGGDSQQYVALAETILTNGRFAMDATAEPESLRTPGYPLFIAVILAICKNIVFLPLAQIVVAAFFCALLFLIGERFFPRPIALVAALLFAIDPAILTNAFVAMSDILFTFVLLCSIYVLTVRKRTLLNLFFVGVLMGGMTLIRPMGLYVITH